MDNDVQMPRCLSDGQNECHQGADSAANVQFTSEDSGRARSKRRTWPKVNLNFLTSRRRSCSKTSTVELSNEEAQQQEEPLSPESPRSSILSSLKLAVMPRPRRS